MRPNRKADLLAELRGTQRAASVMAATLKAALDAQEAALAAWNEDPGNPALMEAAKAATERVRPLIAQAQEWVSDDT